MLLGLSPEGSSCGLKGIGRCVFIGVVKDDETVSTDGDCLNQLISDLHVMTVYGYAPEDVVTAARIDRYIVAIQLISDSALKIILQRQTLSKELARINSSR